MRKMILMALAGLVWKRLQARRARKASAAMPAGRRYGA